MNFCENKAGGAEDEIYGYDIHYWQATQARPSITIEQQTKVTKTTKQSKKAVKKMKTFLLVSFVLLVCITSKF